MRSIAGMAAEGGDQVVGLQQAVNRGLGHEVALLVRKAHGQLPRGEFGLLERQLDDLIMDGRRDAMPSAYRCRNDLRHRSPNQSGTI